MTRLKLLNWKATIFTFAKSPPHPHGMGGGWNSLNFDDFFYQKHPEMPWNIQCIFWDYDAPDIAIFLDFALNMSNFFRTF